MHHLRVRVPGSTSNLGPGFDLLGLALSIELEVEIERVDAAPGSVTWTALEGTAASWPTGGENLVVRALARAADVDGGGVPYSWSARASSEIPLGRGLGSSGAAIAAGLLLGDALAKEQRGPAGHVASGCELEGHPDNVTASLLGGCTLAVPTPGGVHVIRQKVADSIGFAVAWPATPVATEAGRSALPASVPFADAVENSRRLALLLMGLRTGDPELLRLGVVDHLHVRYRLELIRGGAEAILAATDAGAWCATVSGSGSTLIALCEHGAAEEVADAMRATFERVDGPAEGRVVEPVREPPAVERLDGAPGSPPTAG